MRKFGRGSAYVVLQAPSWAPGQEHQFRRPSLSNTHEEGGGRFRTAGKKSAVKPKPWRGGGEQQSGARCWGSWPWRWSTSPPPGATATPAKSGTQKHVSLFLILLARILSQNAFLTSSEHLSDLHVSVSSLPAERCKC